MVSAKGPSLEAKALTTSRVLLFSDAYRHFEGKRNTMREALGGKGAGLAEMTESGVNVPPGLTILTSCCRDYYKNNKHVPDGLFEEVFAELKKVENSIGQELGSTTKPLLVSVRSGAKFSMPGMMDTILNLGLNEETVNALTKDTGNERFVWDSFRRFIQMYGNVVMDISKDDFEDLLHAKKKKQGITSDPELTVASLQELVKEYKDLVKKKTGKDFPGDTKKQLEGAIEAVFRSWNNNRAIYYRNLNKIDHDLGTAVNIQAMVFGNRDNQSATGVCFSRNPSSGEKHLYGEYLINAQGEDVVAGTRTPKKIDDLAKEMPQTYKELLDNAAKLEKYYRDMQDIEFTVDHGRLYILQTRTGKRTAQAAVRVAVELAMEGLIDQKEAILRIEPSQLNQLLLPSFNEEDKAKAKAEGRLLATGLNASPGAAIGKIVFNPAESEQLAGRGEKVILVRVETCPDDIHGLVPAQGVVTSRGGMTSHAAVVARGMGKPCVAGCEALKIDLQREELSVGSTTLKKGDLISIDGSTGEVFKGGILTHEAKLSGEFKELLSWADQVRRLKVRANADTPEDARVARQFGAEGIGLCRTEHMFMSQDRLPTMQEMIMAESVEQRKAALAKILPMQREDFIGLFREMKGLPVTIRLLDPPLHEFLPRHDLLIEEIATMRATGVTGSKLRDKEILLRKVNELHENNPMMGLRGCRLGLINPEINQMQVRAIFEAAIQVKKEGIAVEPEIMIPLVGHVNELACARAQLEEVAKEVLAQAGMEVPYKFGTMIEVPRACVTAGEIAAYAEFFSFGTNDLTQMTFGFSRDDAEGKFLQKYLDGIDVNGKKVKIFTSNPFEALDRSGVGKLMKLAIEYGLQTKPDLKLGICGEHGGEPSSIQFADEVGLHYVSCSPYRIPVARLAAAHAVLTKQDEDK
jgi:pyruvate,orthophosphate dikinase